jgi:hypothetical protein
MWVLFNTPERQWLLRIVWCVIVAFVQIFANVANFKRKARRFGGRAFLCMGLKACFSYNLSFESDLFIESISTRWQWITLKSVIYENSPLIAYTPAGQMTATHMSLQRKRIKYLCSLMYQNGNYLPENIARANSIQHIHILV